MDENNAVRTERFLRAFIRLHRNDLAKEGYEDMALALDHKYGGKPAEAPEAIAPTRAMLVEHLKMNHLRASAKCVDVIYRVMFGTVVTDSKKKTVDKKQRNIQEWTTTTK